MLAWCFYFAAVETNAQATSGQNGSTSQNSSSSGDSTASAITTSDASGNATPLTLDAMAAIQQQRQQLTQQFMQQLQAASSDGQVALVVSFQQQIGNLNASLLPPPLTPDQLAQVSAQQQTDQQALIQSLPPELQATVANLQQRQQLVQQMATATPEQNLALIAQVQQLVVQQEQAVAAQSATVENGTATNVAADAQAQAAQVAALPPDQQPIAQAMIQRQQAIQDAMQLSPDDRVAALKAIQAQPTSTANSDSSSTPSSPSSQP